MMKRKQKRSLAEIVTASVLFVAAVVAVKWLYPATLPATPWWLPLLTYLVPYAVIGRKVLWKAARNIAHGQVFDEHFLMSIATIGALVTGEYPEAVFVMLFYRVGELFEDIAVGKSRASIAALMDIRPDTARVERDGQTVTLPPEDVRIGEVMLVRPGERVALDGVVIDGVSTLDTVALTGESMPRDIAPGDGIVSGCVNLTGLLRVRVTKPAHESTVAKILEMVENVGERKSQSEHFIARFARYYTPLVVAAAAVLAVVPPLFVGVSEWDVWKEWMLRAMSFLVISCPCALVISVPLSFFGGIGGASRQGILVKGSNYLEALAACDTVVFDKTGTLTEGRFSVIDTVSAEGVDGDVDALMRLTTAAESHSTHPIAKALTAGYNGDVPAPRAVEELAGHGVRADVEGRTVLVGNRQLLANHGVTLPDEAAVDRATGTVIYVAVDGGYAGRITVADRPKADAAEALVALRGCGVKRTVLLTGDTEAAASEVAATLGVDTYRAGLLPGDKVAEVEALLADPTRRGRLAFVGDGINDAPVLARADIGIAMGGMGSDAAIETADIVLMDDKPSSIAKAIRLARRTLAIVRQNIAFALGVKAVVLVLAALGLSNLWMAVFADVGVAVLAILNAMRAMKVRL